MNTVLASLWLQKENDKFALCCILLETQAQLETNDDKDQGENLDEDIDDTEEDGYDEQMETEAPVFDEDTTWMPEEVDEAYVKLGDDCDDKKDTDSGYV